MADQGPGQPIFRSCLSLWSSVFTDSTVWRYRDRVVDAFNRHPPYDDVICHQLAGDRLQVPTSSGP